MDKLYLLTGGAGHLGTAILKQLLDMKKTVRVLLLKGEKLLVDGDVQVCYGDVTDANSLLKFFSNPTEADMVVIHTAGVVSISSKHDPLVHKVNVIGTKNIVNLSERSKVVKLVHVSSVHALPEKPNKQEIVEIDKFNPDAVVGLYAKTKAEATQYVLDATVRGLNACVVHPSGIIGPYDMGRGHLVKMVIDYAKGNLPFGICGGYDFVDVRDVAQGVIAATEKGEKGQCYILSNRYYTIEEIFNMLGDIIGEKKVKGYLPVWAAKLVAPPGEMYYKLKKEPPLFTAYSIYTLTLDSRFSNEKAKNTLGYSPRDIKITLEDTLKWLKECGKI